MTAEIARRLPIEIVIDAIENGLTTGTFDLAVKIIDDLETEGWELDCVERPERLTSMSTTDRRHQATCNWNLYAEQRPDPDLCNLECLDRPKEVAAAWAYLAWEEAKAAEQAALTAYSEALVGAVNERNIEMPASPHQGQIFEAEDGRVFVFNGTEWLWWPDGEVPHIDGSKS